MRGRQRCRSNHPALPVVTKSQVSKVAAPTPVTVLFEFRTNGNANDRATESHRSRVIAAVDESGWHCSSVSFPILFIAFGYRPGSRFTTQHFIAGFSG
jgi:hypothetical protein